MRKVDDKIIYALNTSIPTESFKGLLDPVVKCKELHSGLQEAYTQRTSAIKGCISQSAEIVRKIKAERDLNEGDVALTKQFKSEQRKLRLFQQELNIEDIVRERSLNIFNERCRMYYKV